MPPSSVSIDGQTTYRPGSYSTTSADPISQMGAAPRGICAMLGDIRGAEPGVVHRVTSPTRLRSMLDDCELLTAGEIAFDPDVDHRIQGAASLLVVGVNPMTQAQVKLQASAVDVLQVLARKWGIPGNRINLEVADGTSQGKKVTIHFDGSSTVYDNLGGIAALKLSYDPTGDAKTMDVAVDVDTDHDIVISYEVDRAGAAPYVPAKMVFQGKIQFDLSAVVAGDQDIDLIGSYQGQTVTETVTVLDGTDTITTVEDYDEVTSIDLSNIPGGTTVTMSGTSMIIPFSDSDTIQKIIDYILSRGGTRGFDAATALGNASEFDPDQLDPVASRSIHSAVLVDFGADAAVIADEMNRRQTLTAWSRVAGATGAPDNTVAPLFLSGGTVSSPTSDTWQAALDLLKVERVTSLWIGEDNAAYHELARQHAEYLAHRNHRFVFTAAATNETKAEIKGRPLAINSRYFSGTVWQEIEIFRGSGRVWLAPKYFAAMLAGMFAGRPVGLALTWKFPRVLDFRQHSDIDPEGDANEMIKAGTTFLIWDVKSGFPKIERSITCFLAQSIDEYTELSTSESIAASEEDIRLLAEVLVGDTNFRGTANSLKAMIAARLRRQAEPGSEINYLKGWDPATLTVEDVGDGFEIGCGVAGLEPINFIVFKQSTGRRFAVA